MLIGREDLLRFAPNALSPDVTALSLSDHATRVGIDTPRRVRHFMAHLHHESGGFTRLDENLNYSALRLTQVWPSRFKTTSAALPYARNARALANNVYGGRMGNTGPNDGFLYRGGSWIMLTGKTNYTRAKEWTGLDLVTHPEWARDPRVASQIAADFVRAANIIQLWDEDDDEKIVRTMAEQIRVNEEDDLEEGTRAINGGTIGIDDRRTQLQRASLIWK